MLIKSRSDEDNKNYQSKYKIKLRILQEVIKLKYKKLKNSRQENIKSSKFSIIKINL